MEVLDVQQRVELCGDDMCPCDFYHAHRYYAYLGLRDEDAGYTDGWCDNREARGFKRCPRDKTRCYRDMLNDVFDAVDAAYRD